MVSNLRLEVYSVIMIRILIGALVVCIKTKECIQLLRDFPHLFYVMYSNARYTAVFSSVFVNTYRMSIPLCSVDLFEFLLLERDFGRT